MVAVAKFVQLIPIFLAYLVPLHVDVVPNKFHQLISKPQNYVYTCQTNFWKVSSNSEQFKKIRVFVVSMATTAILKILLKRWISIRNIIIYLEAKFRPNRRIFVLCLPLLVQNHQGHHSKSKWSPYGAAYLTPCTYPFPLKSVHFWIFNDCF